MLSKEELFEDSNYLLTKYQNAIYRELTNYMNSRNITKSELAKELGVSNSYVSQIINGNFNFTIKKLIELGIAIGKAPKLEFVDFKDYWENKNSIHPKTVRVEFMINNVEQPIQFLDCHEILPDFEVSSYNLT